MLLLAYLLYEQSIAQITCEYELSTVIIDVNKTFQDQDFIKKISQTRLFDKTKMKTFHC